MNIKKNSCYWRRFCRFAIHSKSWYEWF